MDSIAYFILGHRRDGKGKAGTTEDKHLLNHFVPLARSKTSRFHTMKEIRERSKKEGWGEGKIENSLQFLNSMQAKQMIDR